VTVEVKRVARPGQRWRDDDGEEFELVRLAEKGTNTWRDTLGLCWWMDDPNLTLVSDAPEAAKAAMCPSCKAPPRCACAPECKRPTKPLDANAADVAREASEKRFIASNGATVFRMPPETDEEIAKDMEAINATYAESEAQRRERDQILERMRGGVSAINLGAPFVGGWDRRVRR
jgi:hypothetical protein